MPNVPCPKPGCDWSVDPAVVAAGQVLTCPKCGQRFRLSTTAPAGGSNLFGLLRTAALGLLAVAVLGGIVYLASGLRRKTGGGGGTARVVDTDHNFSVTPPAGWVGDRDTQTALGVNVFAVKRTDPERWAAFAVKDFGNRAPLASELREAMTTTLGKVFDNLPAEPTLEPTTWAGQPASVWNFRGQHKTTGTVVAGEAVVLTHKGVGYWLYGWAAERDFDPSDFKPVRDAVKLLDGRANWRPTVASEQVFAGPAGSYRLTAYEKIWTTLKADGADLELQGVLKGRGNRDFPPKATARVWKLADAGDPMAVGEARVRKENTRDPDVFGPTEFAELTEPPAGEAPPGPEATTAPVKRLRITTGTAESGKVRRLVAFAAVRVGADVVVAEAACPWDEREVWERRLVQLVGSLRD